MNSIEASDSRVFPRHLTEKEASRITGMSVAWFQRKRWEGGGPPYRKINRAVRYPEDQLQAWIESHALIGKGVQ